MNDKTKRTKAPTKSRAKAAAKKRAASTKAPAAAKSASPAALVDTVPQIVKRIKAAPEPAPPPGQIERFDYRSSKPIPAWVQDAIATQFAMEQEDARQAGALGFMARALVVASMPYKDPKTDVYSRSNGNFELRILAGYNGGIPFGSYPRLLMSWLTTEAVRTRSPVIELGDTLTDFFRNVLEVKNITGGTRGTGTLIVEQMKRLFGSMVSATYSGQPPGKPGAKGFSIRNVMIADGLDLEESLLWKPQKADEAGAWKSELRITDNFFREITDRPVPIDMRAYKALRGSPMAMDIYSWLTYRMSYIGRPTHPIPWESLMAQFGSSYSTPQAARDFKKNFLRALKLVQVVYPQARVDAIDRGLILKPSKTSVAIANPQRDLFGGS